MAARQKKKAIPAFQRGREFKVILPPDVSERIEELARSQGKPQSRIIINELSRIVDLDRHSTLEELLAGYKVLLAKFSARMSISELSDEMLRAIDAVLEAKNESDLRARVERMRVTRVGMLEIQKEAKRWESTTP